MNRNYQVPFEQILKNFEIFRKKVKTSDNLKKTSVLINHIKLLFKYMTTDRSSLGSDEDYYSDHARVLSQLVILKDSIIVLAPDYGSTIEREFKFISQKGYSPTDGEIYNFLEHCFDLLEIQNAGEEEIEEGNIYLGLEDKLKRANKSVKEGNIEGLFSNLHTIFEIFLKDRLGIALNMDGAKLGKVLGICIKDEVFKGKNNILIQIDNDICRIDNKLKHEGFNPSANQINDAILIATQGLRVLKNENPVLSKEVKEKINLLLIKND